MFSRLSVCRNNISTRGLLSLAGALSNSPTLTHIYIWGNHLEEPVCQVKPPLFSNHPHFSHTHLIFQESETEGLIFRGDEMDKL